MCSSARMNSRENWSQIHKCDIGTELLRIMRLSFAPRRFAPKSGKVVTAHGVALRGADLRHRRRSDRALEEGAPSLNERDQDRQRQSSVTGLRNVIEAERQ